MNSDLTNEETIFVFEMCLAIAFAFERLPPVINNPPEHNPNGTGGLYARRLGNKYELVFVFSGIKRYCTIIEKDDFVSLRKKDVTPFSGQVGRFNVSKGNFDWVVKGKIEGGYPRVIMASNDREKALRTASRSEFILKIIERSENCKFEWIKEVAVDPE